jgi:DNA invertase Pin-like site-specific DNA recombinase
MSAKTAIYCRVSTPGQKNTTSLPEQERINRAHAATLGWEVSVAHVYREVEGGEDLYRPCMDRLWGAIQAHEIDAVVIDVLDRLSRDEGDLGAVYHHCERFGVQIELASEDIDESDHGRNLRTLAGIMSRMERVEIRRRTQRGRRAHVASGKMLAGPWPLFGYLWADSAKTSYVPDVETAPIVVRLFEAVGRGVSLRQLARELEREGVPTPFQVLAARGQLPAGRVASPIWRRTQIQRMLQHPAYWGEHSAYRYQNTAVKVRPAETGITRKVRRATERATDDPDRVALPATAPALVSKELAERIHARLTQNKAESAGRNPDPLATIWRGRVICGHCDGRMYTGTTSDGYGRRYYCSARRGVDGSAAFSCPGGAFSIGANTLDPSGWADVRAWLSKPENVSRLLAEWEQEEKSAENSVASRLEANAATLATLRDRMASLADDISETPRGESRQVLKEKLDDLATQLAHENGKREKLLREASEATDRARDEHDIREWVRVVASQAQTASREEQRALLIALGARATIWRADYVHPDGWPQRYKIKLTFTGFTGQPVTLPATHVADSDSITLLTGPDPITTTTSPG